MSERYWRYAIAALFVVTGIWAMLVRGNAWPFTMADLNLTEHRALLAHQDLELALAQDELDADAIQKLSREIAASEPLSPLPYEALLVLQFERETIDTETATAFADAVLARDARNLTAHLFLFDQAIIEEDWDRAFDAFGKALTLWPSEAHMSREMMYDSLNDAAWTDALIARLDRGEAWVETFIQDVPIDAVDLMTLANLYRPFPEMHQRFIDRVGRDHGLETAHEVWATLRPEEADRHPFGLIDPMFHGVDAVQPFNWTLEPEYAEIVSGAPGLNVYYRGRNEPTIASQIVFLTEGEHVFEVRVADAPGDPSGDIYWRMSCLPDDTELFRLSVLAPSQQNATSIGFEVPENCDYQELSLIALPGLYTRKFGVAIEQVDLTGAVE